MVAWCSIITWSAWTRPSRVVPRLVRGSPNSSAAKSAAVSLPFFPAPTGRRCGTAEGSLRFRKTTLAAARSRAADQRSPAARNTSRSVSHAFTGGITVTWPGPRPRTKNSASSGVDVPEPSGPVSTVTGAVNLRSRHWPSSRNCSFSTTTVGPIGHLPPGTVTLASFNDTTALGVTPQVGRRRWEASARALGRGVP